MANTIENSGDEQVNFGKDDTMYIEKPLNRHRIESPENLNLNKDLFDRTP